MSCSSRWISSRTEFCAAVPGRSIEFERLHGGPFQFSGFGRDYGGAVFANGAKLKGIGITIAPAENASSKDQENKVMGERRFSSRHAALENLAATVSGLVVGF